jgi:hypothetical protein
VQLDVLDPSAAIDVGLQPSVDRGAEKSPTVVVIVVEPETDVSAALTVCETPAVVLTVKTTFASPSAFVVLVVDENAPPPVLDHVTVLPAIMTALSFASSSRAEIVTHEPACFDCEVAVRRYFAAGPATNSTLALPLVIGVPSSVAPIVALPAVVGAVKVAV